jgi:hypothetical protein
MFGKISTYYNENRLSIFSILLFCLVVVSWITGITLHDYLVQYVLIFLMVGTYFQLHMTLYINYPKTFTMSIFCALGFVLTSGIVGTIICLFTIYKAIKMSGRKV